MSTSSSSLTLTNFFRETFLGFWVTARRKTISAYAESVAHFTRLVGDRPLGDIDNANLARFTAGLVEPQAGRPALRPTTANKHLGQLTTILRQAGLPVKRIPGGRQRRSVPMPGILYVQLHAIPRPRPKAIPPDALEAIYRACGAARFPRLALVAAADWWKGLLAVALVETFRRQGLLGLRWSDVDWQSHTISLPAEADKCLQERRKPLHPIVLRHLVRIRGPWPAIFPWPHSERTFYRQWHAIQDAAAIPKPEHVKLHQLKATSMTHYATCESPWVAQRMGDHASIATGQHYVDVSLSLRGAVERFALPAAFREEFEQGPLTDRSTG